MTVHFNLVVICVCLQSVLALPVNSVENKAEGEFHLFPAWVGELGEIALLIIDFVWHHEIVEEIHKVGEQVEEVDAKIDALLSTSPGASQLFRLRKTYLEEPPDWPTPPIERSDNKQDEKLSKLIKKLSWAMGHWAAPYIG